MINIVTDSSNITNPFESDCIYINYLNWISVRTWCLMYPYPITYILYIQRRKECAVLVCRQYISKFPSLSYNITLIYIFFFLKSKQKESKRI